MPVSPTLEARRAAGALGWAPIVVLLAARTVFAVLAHGVAAGLFALNGSATPWQDAAPFFPLFATLIDLGCLAALWWAMRLEGGRLIDLIGFDRARLGRDVLLGLVLIVPSLLLILGGVAAASFVVYGTASAPMTFDNLPFPVALYALLVFPLLWGFTEQMTYNGYLVSRLQVLGGTSLAVVVVTLIWSFQHAVMPVRFDGDYVLYRALAPIPASIFGVLVYLRIRTIVPLAVGHWLMDGATVVVGSFLPLLR